MCQVSLIAALAGADRRIAVAVVFERRSLLAACRSPAACHLTPAFSSLIPRTTKHTHSTETEMAAAAAPPLPEGLCWRACVLLRAPDAATATALALADRDFAAAWRRVRFEWAAAQGPDAAGHALLVLARAGDADGVRALCAAAPPGAVAPGGAWQAAIDDAVALALEAQQERQQQAAQLPGQQQSSVGLGSGGAVVAAMRAAGARVDVALAAARLEVAGPLLHGAVCARDHLRVADLLRHAPRGCAGAARALAAAAALDDAGAVQQLLAAGADAAFQGSAALLAAAGADASPRVRGRGGRQGLAAWSRGRAWLS